MKKLLAMSVVALLTASIAVAQTDLNPKANDFGVAAYVSYGQNTQSDSVSLLYNLSDSLVLTPTAYFQTDTSATKSSGTTVTNPATTYFGGGLGLLYVVKPFGNLSLMLGPTGYYTNYNYTAGDTHKKWYLEIDLNLRLLAMMTKNFGVFTDIGAYYSMFDDNDTTTSVESLDNGFGLESVALGVAYYFK